MTLAALWSVMSQSLLKGTIGLAVTSAIITVLIFNLGAPLAAVFELSVCTGLITAIFVSAISMTKPMTHKEIVTVSKDRMKRYWYLPVIMAVVGIALIASRIQVTLPLTQKPAALASLDVRYILWNLRQVDLYGQIVLMLAGAFGVVILFREKKGK
jgi:NADH-quinone oxidoreductase subunit J